MNLRAIAALGVMSAGPFACQGDEQPPQNVRDFETAQRELPSTYALQSALMAETCSPNPGVCHQSKEYPELHTPQALVGAIGAFCNVTPPAPELGWDECERRPHRAVFGEFSTPIARTESRGPAEWTLVVGDPIPPDSLPSEPTAEGAAYFQIVDDAGELAFAPAEEWLTSFSVSDDGLAMTFRCEREDGLDLGIWVDPLMDTVVGGDPNANGTWGAGEADGPNARLLVAGSRDRSYLWRRMLGDVPGDRMPIANGPVTNAQMLALGCWIEGLPQDATGIDLAAAIDYDACSFAEDPPIFVVSDEDLHDEQDED